MPREWDAATYDTIPLPHTTWGERTLRHLPLTGTERVLDAEITRRARVLAVERSLSLSGLVAQELERLVSDEDQYQVACRQALADLETGLHLGGARLPARGELHERR